MSNSNLFYNLYSKSKSTISAGYSCTSSIDESATSFDISGDSGVITDSNGNTLASIDMSEIHAEGLTLYNVETRILLPYSCCLLLGNEYGLACATYYFLIPEIISNEDDYANFISISFDVISNTYIPKLTNISITATGDDDIVTLINAELLSNKLDFNVSIQSLEDPAENKTYDYLVFLSNTEGYFYIVLNLKIIPELLSEDYPYSPFSNILDNLSSVVTEVLTSVADSKYTTDMNLYNYLYKNYNELSNETYVNMLNQLNIFNEQYLKYPTSYTNLYTHYSIANSNDFDFMYDDTCYKFLDSINNVSVIYQFYKSFDELYLYPLSGNETVYSYDLITNTYTENINGNIIYATDPKTKQLYYTYIIPCIKCEKNIKYYNTLFFEQDNNGEYINVSELDKDDTNGDIIIKISDYKQYIINDKINNTLITSELVNTYGIELLYNIINTLYLKINEIVFKEYYWIDEDINRRIPLMKYPNGAFRGIVIIPDWPDAEDYTYSTLWLHHIKDVVTLYEPVNIPKYTNLFYPHVYGVLSNAIVKDELLENDNCQIISNNGLNYNILDGYEDNIHCHNEYHHSQICENNINADDIAYIGLNMYAHKKDVIGIYRYMQYVNDNNLWVNLGDTYMIVGKDDDPQSFVKNLQSSILLYNPNDIPVRIKYLIFS